MRHDDILLIRTGRAVDKTLCHYRNRSYSTGTARFPFNGMICIY